MALINCPECSEEQSDKANSCIKCGFPVAEHFSNPANVFEVPTYKSSVTLSHRYGGYYFSRFFLDGFYSSELSPFSGMRDGKVEMMLFGNGIRLLGKKFTVTDISFEQIVSIELDRVSSNALENKSVLGRAAIGGILLGGIGAVVGALSGQGKIEQNYEYVLSIILHKSESFRQISVLFNSEKNVNFAKKVIEYYHKQKELGFSLARKEVGWKSSTGLNVLFIPCTIVAAPLFFWVPFVMNWHLIAKILIPIWALFLIFKPT